MLERRLNWAVLGLGVMVPLVRAAEAEPPARNALTHAVRRAFQDVHAGWSADEVLVRDDLNAAFLRRCRELAPNADAGQCNWTLLNLRKAGQLDVPATQRDPRRHEAYFHAAEIAARFLYDRHQLTIDRVLCDPERRREFDELARALAPDVPADRLRKAALGLRKARELRPELVTRVADWGKEIVSYSARQLVDDPQLIPARPGVYVFRDTTGYLYIGEAANLRDTSGSTLMNRTGNCWPSICGSRGSRESRWNCMPSIPTPGPVRRPCAGL